MLLLIVVNIIQSLLHLRFITDKSLSAKHLQHSLCDMSVNSFPYVSSMTVCLKFSQPFVHVLLLPHDSQ